MLICFWSPKGGSGTSVAAAATALVLAARASTRLADLAGDQPGVFGVGDPSKGLREWLRAGPEAPVDALDRLALTLSPRLTLIPAGSADITSALPEAGAALAVALRDDPRTTVADAGTIDPTRPASAVDAFVEVADASILVVRSCYLALRRAVRVEATTRATGALLLHESGRALSARDVADVLGVPVLATLPVRNSTARAVDAGVLPTRLPDVLVRAVRGVLQRIGGDDSERAA